MSHPYRLTDEQMARLSDCASHPVAGFWPDNRRSALQDGHAMEAFGRQVCDRPDGYDFKIWRDLKMLMQSGTTAVARLERCR